MPPKGEIISWQLKVQAHVRRPMIHKWFSYNTGDCWVQLQYGYNRANQRRYRQDIPAHDEGGQNLDELYAYDGLDQVKELRRGLLNAGHTALQPGTENFREAFGYDTIGNWRTYQRVDDSGTLNQDRTFNTVNEITRINTTDWTKPRYDAAGNTTRIPGANDPAAPFRVDYDAWNRPTRIFSFDGEWKRYRAAVHSYDARGWRIRSLEYHGTGSNRGKYQNTRDYYYDEQWRTLEEYVQTDAADQQPGLLERVFVWDYAAKGYPDALLLRLRDTNGDGDLDERLYALQDAHFNTVAVINADGITVERYNYSAFGIPNCLDSDFIPQSESTCSWEVLFSGYFKDRLTGLYYVRNRYYHSQLGRWITRDPIGEEGGINLYAYVSNNPINLYDANGFSEVCCPPKTLQIDPACIKACGKIYIACMTGAGLRLAALLLGCAALAIFNPLAGAGCVAIQAAIYFVNVALCELQHARCLQKCIKKCL